MVLCLARSIESPMIRLILISWTLLTLCGSRASDEVSNRDLPSSPVSPDTRNSFVIQHPPNHAPLPLPHSLPEQTGLVPGEEAGSGDLYKSTLHTSISISSSPDALASSSQHHLLKPPSEGEEDVGPSSSPLHLVNSLPSLLLSSSPPQNSISKSPISSSSKLSTRSGISPQSSFLLNTLVPGLGSSSDQHLHQERLVRERPSIVAGLAQEQSLDGPLGGESESHINHPRDKRSLNRNHHPHSQLAARASYLSSLASSASLSGQGRNRLKHSWQRRKSYYNAMARNPSNVLKQSSSSATSSSLSLSPHSNPQSSAPKPASPQYQPSFPYQFSPPDEDLAPQSQSVPQNTFLAESPSKDNELRYSVQQEPPSSLWRPESRAFEPEASLASTPEPVLAARRSRSMDPQSDEPQDSPAEAFAVAGQDLARNLMMRSTRSGRRYDVPQIECPRSSDRMERFSCPTPDFRGRYRCIDDRSLCDGFIDCPGREDENPDQCLFYKTTKAHLDILAEALLRWARGR